MASFHQNVISKILRKILTAVLDGRSHLKRLKVQAMMMSAYSKPLPNLLSLDPGLLSQALVRLEEFSFDPNRNHFEDQSGTFSTVQLVSIFTAIEQTDNLKLKSLELPDWPCSNVPPELFGNALVRTETVDLGFNGVSRPQVSSLFRKIAQSEGIRLRNLDLKNVKISHISPVIFSQATVKLQTLKAPGCNLTSEQLSAVLTQLSLVDDHKLRILDLSDNDLSSVRTKTLVGGISGLERVELKHTKLNIQQKTGIFRMVADRRCSRLRKIVLGRYIDLRHVSRDLCDRAKLNKSVIFT